MENNFIDGSTGEEFFVAKFTIGFDKGIVYKDSEGKILRGSDGKPLNLIDRDRGICTAIQGSSAERHQAMQNNLKERAKKHYQTDIRYRKKAAGDKLGSRENLKQ